MGTGADDSIYEADAEASIAANDVDRLRLIPIETSLHHDERGWATRICVALASHADPIVRGNAVLGLGHLARRFEVLDEQVRAVVERALLDPEPYVRGQSRSAADDIRRFVRWTFSVGTSVDRVLWEGSAAGRTWRARQLDWIAPGERLGDVWSLTIETTDGEPREELACWWSPDDRVLGGTLPGWSKAAIGNLKRALAQSPAPTID